MARDDEGPWSRQLLLGIGALVAVALLVGGVVGVAAVLAARVTGLGNGSGAATAPASLYFPSGDPTTSPQAYPAPKTSASASTSPSTAAPSPTESPTKSKPSKQITLQGYPNRVSTNQRINLTGAYEGAEGATLQVQRFENGWVDFPVTASVSGGLFSTYVTTGRTGTNRFRMLDKGSGRHSNAVSITVR